MGERNASDLLQEQAITVVVNTGARDIPEWKRHTSSLHERAIIHSLVNVSVDRRHGRLKAAECVLALTNQLQHVVGRAAGRLGRLLAVQARCAL